MLAMVIEGHHPHGIDAFFAQPVHLRMLMHQLLQKNLLFHTFVKKGLFIQDLFRLHLLHVLTGKAVIRLGYEHGILFQKCFKAGKIILTGHQEASFDITFKVPEEVGLDAVALLILAGGHLFIQLIQSPDTHILFPLRAAAVIDPVIQVIAEGKAVADNTPKCIQHQNRKTFLFLF